MRDGGTGSSPLRGRGPTPVVDPDRIPVVEHGGAPPGRRAAPFLDLSLSTNPYGPPPYFPLVLERGRREVDAYPDRFQGELTRQLESSLRLDPGTVLPAGSASELLRIAIGAYGPGRRVLLGPHTYGEFRRIASSVGSTPVEGPMPGGWVMPVHWAELVRQRSLVVLANPGTPSGQYLTPRQLSPIVEAAARTRSLVLVDESYLPFVRRGQSIAGRSDNVVTVFSWSKVLGTPGLPLGHAVGPRDVIRALRAHILPWSVGPFAKHLGLLALERPAWTRTTVARVSRTAVRVRTRLRSRSRTNYFMVRSRSGPELAGRLAARGFRVRDLTQLGLPQYVRFAVRRETETQAFLSALEDVRGVQSREGGPQREASG